MKMPKRSQPKIVVSITSEEKMEAAATASLGWPEIDETLFAGALVPAPAFPLDALPPAYRKAESGIAEARRIHLDLVATTAIAIVSGVVGTSVRLAITARRSEPATVFVALVVDPGNGKSEAIGVGRE